MSDEISRSLTERPDEIEVGGKLIKIPPITYAKFDLLSEHLDRLKEIHEGGNLNDSPSAKIKAALKLSARAFVILTKPNDEDVDIEEPTDEEIRAAKRKIRIEDAPRIAQVIFASFSVEHLLKNGETPQGTETMTLPGANSLPEQSDEQGGASITLPEELASEV